MRLPSKEKAIGKWGKSLTLTVGVSEPTNEDGGITVIQPELEHSGQIMKEVAVGDGATVDTSMQVTKDSLLVPQTNEIVLLANEIEAAGSVLLCIAGVLNGIEVTFLIDSGANEYFLSTSFVEKNRIKTSKTKEKLTIQLADGTVRVSNLIVQ